LSTSSLTSTEYAQLAERAAREHWLKEQPPERFGLNGCALAVGAIGAAVAAAPIDPEFALSLREELPRWLPYVAAWAHSAGVELPSPERARTLKRWPGPWVDVALESRSLEPLLLALWVLDRGPVYFGFSSWSLATELLNELQITGIVARRASECRGR
jgi:hypothetical protein